MAKMADRALAPAVLHPLQNGVANLGRVYSRYYAKTEFNNYFIIHIGFMPNSYKFNYFDKMLELLYLISKMFPLLLTSADYS